MGIISKSPILPGELVLYSTGAGTPTRLSDNRSFRESAPHELRRSLFKKRSHSLAMILRLSASKMRLRLTIEERAKIDCCRPVHVLLHIPVAGERTFGDPAPDCRGLFGESIRLDHPIHEADAMGFGCVDRICEEK